MRADLGRPAAVDGEACDDGNTKETSAIDFCSADCKTTTWECGDWPKGKFGDTSDAVAKIVLVESEGGVPVAHYDTCTEFGGSIDASDLTYTASAPGVAGLYYLRWAYGWDYAC